MNLYDAHNHFQDHRLASTHEQIIRDLQSVSLARMVVNGTCERDWPKVLKLARKHDFIIPSFGYHPWYLDQHTPNWETRLNAHLDAVPSAVGEIGLDRWMKNADDELQEQMFVTQLHIAAERNLPVSIHCLKAWGQLLDLLQDNPRPERGFLLHSYGGSAEMIPRFAELGGYFSISGYFAHERKAKQLNNFRTVPPDRLLIETDAPDMWPPDPVNRFPQPEVNHPANIGPIYDFVADALDLSVHSLALRTEQNFQRIFAHL
ncbi:MAG: TatD family hydrolase [Limisphaerales bacterium]